MMRIFLLVVSFFVFINQVIALPVDFVYLKEVNPTILQDMRYSGYHNFVGRPVKGYMANTCILTRQAAQALSKVQRELFSMSLSLKVYDCYRPTMAVHDFMTWSQDARHQEMKEEFYPATNKAELFKLGYVAERSGHSRGSTIDLTIVPHDAPLQAEYRRGQRLISCTSPQGIRFHDNSVDMGTGFDCMDEMASVYHADINSPAFKNRMKLREIMMKNGFVPYEKEWWHFTLQDEPFPQTYFNFVVK